MLLLIVLLKCIRDGNYDVAVDDGDADLAIIIIASYACWKAG